MRQAWQVGALVVVFVALVMATMAVLKEGAFQEKYDQYFALFDDVAGLTSGSPILVAGVKVGEVGGVKLTEAGKAQVTLHIYNKFKIQKGSSASVPTSLISVGDRQVNLIINRNATEYYATNNVNDPIPGDLKSAIDSFLPDSEKTIEELNRTLVSIQTLLGDQELKDGLVSFMKSGEETATKFGQTADSITRLVSTNSGQVNSMMKSVSASLENLYAVSVRVKEIAEDPRFINAADELLTTLNSAAEEGALLVKDLRAYTSDPEMKESLNNILANFESMSQSGSRIASDVEVMSQNGIEITEETKELLKKANKVAIDVENALKDIKGTVKEVIGGGTAASLFPEIGIEADLMLRTDPSRLRSDVNFTFDLGEEDIIFGFYDAFESNKLNLMLRKEIDEKLDFRYGVYASKPGVGVSYNVAPNLWLRSELFGLNNPQLDIRMRYDFSDNFHGWLGVEKLFGRSSPSIGIGFRK